MAKTFAPVDGRARLTRPNAAFISGRTGVSSEVRVDRLRHAHSNVPRGRHLNWLVTGGCGFIGRVLIADLLRSDDVHVRVLDNLSVGSRADLAAVSPFADFDPQSAWQPSLSLIEGDITHKASVETAMSRAEIVVHLAANTGVGPSVEDPESRLQDERDLAR